MKRVHVVAAVIRKEQNILLSKRLAHAHQGGKWEFPGGKVEAGEAPDRALRRELKEELGIDAGEFLPLIQIQHDYPDKSVFLDVWEVSDFVGEPCGMEGQQVKWVNQQALSEYEFPAANLPIVTAAQLPRCYWITPEPENLEEFFKMVESQLEAGTRLIQLRAKQAASDILADIVIRFMELKSHYQVAFFLNGDTYQQLQAMLAGSHYAVPERRTREGLNEAMYEVFCGVHLTSDQLQKTEQLALPSDWSLAASCHSLEELERARQLGCWFATLSPIKLTRSHPDRDPLNELDVKNWLRLAKLPVYALGGLSRDDLVEMRQQGFQGVAGISML